MHHRSIPFLVCGAIVSIAACGGVEATSDAVTPVATARTALDQSVVNGCLACHRGALSLENETAEDLVAAIARISAGELDHVAPIPELSEEDTEALARVLAGDD